MEVDGCGIDVVQPFNDERSDQCVMKLKVKGRTNDVKAHLRLHAAYLTGERRILETVTAQ